MKDGFCVITLQINACLIFLVIYLSCFCVLAHRESGTAYEHWGCMYLFRLRVFMFSRYTQKWHYLIISWFYFSFLRNLQTVLHSGLPVHITTTIFEDSFFSTFSSVFICRLMITILTSVRDTSLWFRFAFSNDYWC